MLREDLALPLSEAVHSSFHAASGWFKKISSSSPVSPKSLLIGETFYPRQYPGPFIHSAIPQMQSHPSDYLMIRATLSTPINFLYSCPMPPFYISYTSHIFQDLPFLSLSYEFMKINMHSRILVLIPPVLVSCPNSIIVNPIFATSLILYPSNDSCSAPLITNFQL